MEDVARPQPVAAQGSVNFPGRAGPENSVHPQIHHLRPFRGKIAQAEKTAPGHLVVDDNNMAGSRQPQAGPVNLRAEAERGELDMQKAGRFAPRLHSGRVSEIVVQGIATRCRRPGYTYLYFPKHTLAGGLPNRQRQQIGERCLLLPGEFGNQSLRY